MKKRIILASIAAVSTLGIAGTSALAVAGSGTEGTLIDKLTTKFNLNKDEVEAVFDEARDEAQADRQAEYSERLQEKVDDGDITAEQKTLIEEKMAELDTARDTDREELETWAEDNGITAKYLMMGRGRWEADSDRLQDAVDDGDITAEQKTLIEEKQEQLKNEREATRDSLEQWAEDNDLDLQDVLPMGRGGLGRGDMMR